MISNGHSWSSIKKYTLAEIGAFYKTVILLKREIQIETLINNWMSTHYEHETLMNTIKVIEGKSYRKIKSSSEPSKEEVRSEWLRLARTMKQGK